ncbi:hypothetical protein Q4610_18735 [Sphingobium sp. HBC34]|uniref:Uncharacterized protein n=1 Tax=Sphingobium cyanobacteriorum TaxID=3063954 RepID=A0ABT8ZSX4_9SPHN|nr:hypothetical protein [Sphingobium sp. HBC34]MDO7837084.1 hypothetical protein [Sphingobium sp. HBC34]
MSLLPTLGVAKLKWLRQTFKIVVEVSSILTILSFIFSSTLLFLTLQLNNIRFSDVVTVDDIVIAGVNFAARSTWIFSLTLPLTFLIARYFSGAIHMTLRRMKPWSWRTTLTNVGHYLVFSFLVCIVFSLVILGIVGSFSGVSIVAAAAPSGDGVALIVGAMIIGWLYAALVMAAYLGGGPFSAPVSAELTIGNEEQLLPRVPSRWFDPVHLLKVTLIYCFVLSIISGFSERAWFFRQPRDLDLITLQQPDVGALCGKHVRRIIWIGTSSVVLQCGRRRVLVKGLENVIVI